MHVPRSDLFLPTIVKIAMLGMVKQVYIKIKVSSITPNNIMFNNKMTILEMEDGETT